MQPNQTILPPESCAFYTVTNRHYFPGTVATISSIRTFYPCSPIYVFTETRAPLNSTQLQHLAQIPGVFHVDGQELPFASVREAWQMKAHGARYLAERQFRLLVHVDSDAVICGNLDEIIRRVVEQGRAAGGRDGRGTEYTMEKYAPYLELCGLSAPPPKLHNSDYISTSVLFLPLPALRPAIDLWSKAVDVAHFGPASRPVKLYHGYGDQGVLNGILFFLGLRPIVLENSSLSEHWVHGKETVTFAQGTFRKGAITQLAFHSVGGAPKFWTADYLRFVERTGTVHEVYLYWLFLLFDGPCGLFAVGGSANCGALGDQFYPDTKARLVDEYLRRRRPQLRRVIEDFCGLYRPQFAPINFGVDSPNVLCCLACAGYLDSRGDVHYFYSAVQRFQNYRALGGKADLVIFANQLTLASGAAQSLLQVAHSCRITVIVIGPGELAAALAAYDIDVATLKSQSIAWLEEGKAAGRFTAGVRPEFNVLVAMEVYLGRLPLVAGFVQQKGYQRCALCDADGGRYEFTSREIPTGCHVDDLWKFDSFTDLVYQETATGRDEFHGITPTALAALYGLRNQENCLPMFQTSAHWIQGTAGAFGKYVELALRQIPRFEQWRCYSDDELITTPVILKHGLWPDFGAMAGHSLRRQLEVTSGTGEPWYRPSYALAGEEKYTRTFLAPPVLSGRYAITIVAFDEPSELKSRKYSTAAGERIQAYQAILRGRMDLHVFTDNVSLKNRIGVKIHHTTAEELVTSWDARGTQDHFLPMQEEARLDPARHRQPVFVKNPQYALGMISKLVAAERIATSGYDGVLSADADGLQFSRETLGALGHLHIDSIWKALEHHPFISYIVGSATEDSFNVWLSILRDICGLPPTNAGPVDWIWGPCWMMRTDFANDFLREARCTLKKLLDRRVVFYDEHILNCTYNLSRYDANPLGGMRDLGDPAAVGYRELNPRCFLRYKRWGGDHLHTGRKHREYPTYYRPAFSYAR